MARRREHFKKLSLDDIHTAVRKGIQNHEDGIDTDGCAGEDPPMLAVKDMNDQLHTLSMQSRPKTTEDIQDFTKVLMGVIQTAGDDSKSWKLFMLSLIRRRYHLKAPENKELSKKRKTDGLVGEEERNARHRRRDGGGREGDRGGRGRGRGGGRGVSDSDTEGDNGDGDGERLILYLAMIILSITAKKGSEPAAKACQCLARLALPAGGTRDLCSFLEHVIYVDLYDQGFLKDNYEKGEKSTALQQSIRYFVSKKNSDELMEENDDEKMGGATTVLDELLDTCALLLDRDLELVRQSSPSSNDLPSTLHTFIPHRDRGTKSRNVVQTVAEVLIWSRSASAMINDSFSTSWYSICKEESFIKSLHSIQTTTRRLRKELNDSARENGFSLYTSFRMGSTITLSMLKKGKENDVAMVQKLASKARNHEIMKMIGARMMDPKKAIAVESISKLIGSWIPLNKTYTVEKQEKEMMDLQLQIQEATVRATIEQLRNAIPKSKDASTNAVTIVASLDNTVTSDASAVLIAAALDNDCVVGKGESKANQTDDTTKAELIKSAQVQLFIGEEQWQVSELGDVMQRLDNVFSSSRERLNNEDEAATTKAVQNLIERHLKPGGQLILFASADVKLEARILEKLQKDNTTIHCHINDEFSRRMNREKAKVGDLTVTLIWEDYSDLDLHVHCPDGSHISYSNKEACGGYLDVDMNAGGAQSEEPVENVFFGDAEKNIEAAHGKYKVVVQNFSYHGHKLKNPDKVPFKVRILMDGKETQYTGACTGEGERSNQAVIEFEYNGRTTVPSPEATGSLLEASNLVAVTSSVGETIDALKGLMKLKEQHEQLNTIRDLIAESDDAAMVVEESSNERPIMASSKAFDITSRDRLYLNLSRLPPRFHQEVGRSFGGDDLMEIAASDVARRLIADKIKLEELKKSGYPPSIVQRVKDKMLMVSL